MRQTAPALAAMLLAWPLLAAQVDDVQVTHEDSRYRVTMRVTLDAPPAASWDAFANPMNLPKINPAVREVRVLERRGAETLRVYTRVEVCVALYCKRLQQVQEMDYARNDYGGRVQARVHPALSDFRYGHASWIFSECDARTCLSFEAELEPAFWVPPVVGPWLIQRRLRQDAIETSRGLERLAREAGP